MRLIARFIDEQQASGLIDSLRIIGFHRKDMIVSSLAKEQTHFTFRDAVDEVTFIKTEGDSLNELDTFAAGIPGLKGKEGVIVAVEASKHATNRIREAMEQAGAVEIIQD
ncbi:hypothetical protein [Alkaliphilus peptidifermentans]|uniref:Nitrogen regulatory protein P-II n=1 Tax=Alkaliphilus peptidifermentans DSM 18978 TaxID=1120976 RepID=A0A1G5K3J4_9FIRM|nr:hypothetical protein [Alkaliphilus peptidifermentans]SCY94439.1 hypothetical protein SAMN03080606_03174 [Alkaliphilus peptidifermentans DSM 18978]